MRPTNSSNSTRTPDRASARLASTLDKQLLSYAAAATAAGIGLLTLAQPAEAKVVFTPSNVPIPENGSVVQIDLNHDGVPDFGFTASFYFGAARPPLGLYRESLAVLPAQASNEVGAMTSSKGTECAAKLREKVKIGPGRDFKPSQLLMFQVAGDYTNQFSAHCPWLDKQGGFVGLKFVVNGETHYGWARISLVGGTFIRGYAYETIPNQLILTGATSSPGADNAVSTAPDLPTSQPATLGLLAQGALSLAIWRRPEEEMN
jgi:hypothetical protein